MFFIIGKHGAQLIHKAASVYGRPLHVDKRIKAKLVHQKGTSISLVG